MRIETKKLAASAAAAALYVVLTLVSSALGLAFGPVQLRLSEALCVLPFCLSGVTPGLVLGCAIANLLSPYGLVDLLCGSIATLLAALWTARIRKKALAPLPAVVCNGLIIGAMLTWYELGFASGFLRLFALNALYVALGEAASCYLFGGLMMWLIPKTPLLGELRKGDDR